MAVVARKGCPQCGSRNNVAVYEDGGEHCFTPGCGHHVFGEGSFGAPAFQPKSVLEMTGEIQPLTDRGISHKIAKKYQVRVTYDQNGKIAEHRYPYFNTKTREAAAFKIRTTANKGFRWNGDRTDTGLFGQQTCRGKGKYVTLVEGELDALSVSEMFDGKWDVVSIKDGATSARRDVQEQLEFLEGYDTIVLCFDGDEAGREGVESIKDLFSPNKLRIVRLPSGFKDPNQMLLAGKVSEFVKSWWDAKPYSPAGIISPSDTWEQVLSYKHTPSVPYPWKGLNDILMGQRKGELNIWAAETGVGKSQTMREVIYHNMNTTSGRVGCLMLEESVAKSMMGWMSFHAGRPLHKDPNVTDEELRKYWEQASAGDKFVLLDHKGWQSDIDKLKSRVRFMAKSLGCESVVLDHLHIALSSVSGASGDWAGIDELVTQLTVLAQECDICLHLVSHVSEGRALRGSKGISKLADAVIFLERDKHNEDPEIANVTTVVVDKNRWAGDCGTACYLKYDRFTGRMTECAKPESMVVVDEF